MMSCAFGCVRPHDLCEGMLCDAGVSGGKVAGYKA